MIVCLCHAVSDRTLRDLAATHPADEVVRLTGAGTGCGACRGEVARILAAAAPCRAEAPCPGCPHAVAAASAA